MGRCSSGSIAAVGCALLVLAAAGAARHVVRLGEGGDEAAERTAAWTAVLTAMLVGNMFIDPAAAKGEILGIPFVMGSILLSLRALERRSAGAAFGAGLLALLAVGLKQNMVAGLVFGGIMLLGSLLARRITRGEFARMAAAAVAGAAVPVVATVAWALVAGVHLEDGLVRRLRVPLRRHARDQLPSRRRRTRHAPCRC